MLNENKMNLFQSYVDTINNMIQILKENNITIKDYNDEEWSIDYISYSSAKDEVYVKMKWGVAMSDINLSLNDERWCTECGNFVMPVTEIDINEVTGEETTFIICPECGRCFKTLWTLTLKSKRLSLA